MTNERNIRKFNTVILRSYEVFGSEIGNVFRDAVIEDGYSGKRNVKSGCWSQMIYLDEDKTCVPTYVTSTKQSEMTNK
jgi:hypothetical protein